jgi:hypothetical protein
MYFGIFLKLELLVRTTRKSKENIVHSNDSKDSNKSADLKKKFFVANFLA